MYVKQVDNNIGNLLHFAKDILAGSVCVPPFMKLF